MKKEFLKKVVIALLASATLGGSASAQIIGIDFYLSSPTNQSPGSSAVVGPSPSAGWNNEVDPSTTPGPGTIALYSSTSAVTPTTATFGFNQGGNTLSGNPIYNSNHGPQGSANATLSADQQLYNGSVSAVASSWSQEMVLRNIPYATYDVYILVTAERIAHDTTDITASVQNFNGGVSGGAGTTYYLKNSFYSTDTNPTNLANGYIQGTGNTYATATAGGNYVRFTGLTSANETFDFLNVTPSGQPYSPDVTLGAVEIVDDVTVPEPSTYALMLGGLLLLVGMGWFRQRSV